MRNKLKKLTHEDTSELLKKILILTLFLPMIITAELLIILTSIEMIQMIIQILGQK